LMITGYKIIRSVISRITAVKSPRGVSFALTVLSLASKPLGYARTLFVAWAFGTSAGMDSFHLASGIIILFAGSAGNAIENAVLPELVRLREETGDAAACRSLAAFISCFILTLASLFILLIMTAPDALIRFFAGGFDRERIMIGSRMLKWLVPFAFIMTYRPMLDIWATFTERYTLNSLIATLFNFITIPALVISIPFIETYSVAFSMSAGHIIIYLLFMFAMRGAPVVWKSRDVAWDSVRRIGKNSFYMLVILASGTLYTVVDRYFASSLPVGSVSAISYAMIVTGLLSALVSTPMTYFLSMIAKSAATNVAESLETVNNAIALSMAYLIPASAFMVAAARPIVTLIFGWGSFDAESVSMTSTCLAAYSLGFSFSLASGLIYRYAVATRKLGAITMLTYAFVGMNALLDWIFIRRWGLLGLTLATSVTHIICFVLYYLVIIGASLTRFLADSGFIAQLALSSLCALTASLAASYGTAAHLAASGVLFTAYMITAERAGLMKRVPRGWQPSQFALFVFSAAKSYIKIK